MSAAKAASIHFGSDEHGFYFGYVDRETLIWQSINLTQNQTLLLGKQVFEAIFAAKLGSEACDADASK